MKKNQDRIKIVKDICFAAKLYKENLVGKTFLYVFDGRYIEVLYKASNFRHLTGVDTNLSAKQFYEYALKNQLQASQINFNSIHPYSLCKRKIRHIKDISNLAMAESFMLEEINTKTTTYKFGTTDMNFTLCLNKEKDKDGNEKGTCYIVQSLRDEDCFPKAANVYEVTHILTKSNNQKFYSKVLYIDKQSSLDDLPIVLQNILKIE